MAYCIGCGEELPTGARFCAICGTAVPVVEGSKKERETVYEGAVHKCPSCGEILTSFTGVCPICGFELRDASGSATAKEFAERFEKAKTEASKTALIRSFPIPNTKEDIIEFMILACSNFDAEDYVKNLGIDDISDAWLAKIEQCFKKASIVFPDATEYKKMVDMYNGVHTKIERCKKSEATEETRRPFSGFSSTAAPSTPTSTTSATAPPKTGEWSLFVACLFLGYLGVHKFIEGKTGMGVLYLLTGGLFGIGWFVDIFAYLGKALK